MKRKILFQAAIRGVVLLFGVMSAVAQTNSYQQTIVVTATSGALSHTTTINLTVQ